MDTMYKFPDFVRNALDPTVFRVEDESNSHWARISRYESDDQTTNPDEDEDEYDRIHYLAWVSQGYGDDKKRLSIRQNKESARKYTEYTNEDELNDALRVVVARLLMGDL